MPGRPAEGERSLIGGIGNTNFDLWASGRRPENFYMLGSMGARALEGEGPWFIGARIDGEKPAGVTERDPVRIRSRFMDALAQKR